MDISAYAALKTSVTNAYANATGLVGQFHATATQLKEHWKTTVLLEDGRDCLEGTPIHIGRVPTLQDLSQAIQEWRKASDALRSAENRLSQEERRALGLEDQ